MTQAQVLRAVILILLILLAVENLRGEGGPQVVTSRKYLIPVQVPCREHEAAGGNVVGEGTRVVPGGWEGVFYVNPIPVTRRCDQRVPWNETDLIFHSEFGYELIIMAPFAYFLKQSCYDISVMTTQGGSALYSFFTTNITETRVTRQSLPEDFSCCPLKTVHTPRLKRAQWAPPPYKTAYQNWFFTYEKPLLIISNKYQVEWGRNPKNYLSPETLSHIVDRLLPFYTIVYSRPSRGHIAPDGSRLLDMDEKDDLRNKGVLVIEDLYQTATEVWGETFPYNLFQFWVFANSDRFIAVQGGNAVLSAYMAGETGLVHVYVARGREVVTSSVEAWYQELSGASVKSFKTQDDLVDSLVAFIPPPRSLVRSPPEEVNATEA